jgi:TPR repeat protein
LDIYAEASEHGSAEALFLWASLMLFGSENSNSPCGVSQEILQNNIGADYKFDDLTRGAYAMLLSASMGYVSALVPVATLISNGIGLQQNFDIDYICNVMQEIPLIKAFYQMQCDESGSSLEILQIGSTLQSVNNALKLFAFVLSTLSEVKNTDEDFSFSRDMNSLAPLEVLSSAILHSAMLLGSDDAAQALGYRYKVGLGVVADSETSAYYFNMAVGTASKAYHTIGGQPLMETDRLNDHTAKSVIVGNAGDSDELIQHQLLRADEGHVPSALAMADLYYYGARGVPRDQQRAMQYYLRTADKGDLTGMCGAANMYLRGEGII